MPEETANNQPTPQPQPQGTIPTPTEVVEDVKKGNYNKSVILMIVLVLLTVILLAVSFLATRKSTPASYVTKKVETSFAKTSLSVSEDIRPTSVSGVYETDINIDSGGNKVTGVQLSLSFDPKTLTKVDIKPGSFLGDASVISKVIDAKTGTITFLFGTAQGKGGVTGSGQLAVISFSKATDEDTDINFLPDTLITAQGYDQSVLSKTTSAVIGPLPTK